MIKGSRRVKDLIKNRAKGDSAKSQALMRHYAMERFLERMSISRYRDNLILKGGMLMASVLGIDSRTTMDIDTTIKGVTLDVGSAAKIVSEIADIGLEDDMAFVLKEAYRIMEDSEYGGVRVPIEAILEGRVRIPMKIDISTGDAITPGEVEYGYGLMFENRSIGILTYPVETVLAEKIETAITRGALNTRMKDYYDIYMLSASLVDISGKTLATAIVATSEKRRSALSAGSIVSAVDSIARSAVLSERWQSYAAANDYARGIPWSDSIDALRIFCDIIVDSLPE